MTEVMTTHAAESTTAIVSATPVGFILEAPLHDQDIEISINSLFEESLPVHLPVQEIGSVVVPSSSSSSSDQLLLEVSLPLPLQEMELIATSAPTASPSFFDNPIIEASVSLPAQKAESVVVVPSSSSENPDFFEAPLPAHQTESHSHQIITAAEKSVLETSSLDIDIPALEAPMEVCPPSSSSSVKVHVHSEVLPASVKSESPPVSSASSFFSMKPAFVAKASVTAVSINTLRSILPVPASSSSAIAATDAKPTKSAEIAKKSTAVIADKTKKETKEVSTRKLDEKLELESLVGLLLRAMRQKDEDVAKWCVVEILKNVEDDKEDSLWFTGAVNTHFTAQYVMPFIDPKLVVEVDKLFAKWSRTRAKDHLAGRFVLSAVLSLLNASKCPVGQYLRGFYYSADLLEVPNPELREMEKLTPITATNPFSTIQDFLSAIKERDVYGCMARVFDIDANVLNDKDQNKMPKKYTEHMMKVLAQAAAEEEDETSSDESGEDEEDADMLAGNKKGNKKKKKKTEKKKPKSTPKRPRRITHFDAFVWDKMESIFNNRKKTHPAQKSLFALLKKRHGACPVTSQRYQFLLHAAILCMEAETLYPLVKDGEEIVDVSLKRWIRLTKNHESLCMPNFKAGSIGTAVHEVVDEKMIKYGLGLETCKAVYLRAMNRNAQKAAKKRQAKEISFSATNPSVAKKPKVENAAAAASSSSTPAAASSSPSVSSKSQGLGVSTVEMKALKASLNLHKEKKAKRQDKSSSRLGDELARMADAELSSDSDESSSDEDDDDDDDEGDCGIEEDEGEPDETSDEEEEEDEE